MRQKQGALKLNEEEEKQQLKADENRERKGGEEVCNGLCNS